MNMISIDDLQDLVLVFMSYYYWLDIDFNGLCVKVESLLFLFLCLTIIDWILILMVYVSNLEFTSETAIS